jgi:hypothetical protein
MMGEIVMQIMSQTTDYDDTPTLWAAQQDCELPRP